MHNPVFISYRNVRTQEYRDIFDIKAIIGFVLISIGFIYLNYKRISNWFKPKEYYICPRCEERYEKEIYIDKICPKCETNLEDLNGFYEHQNDNLDPAKLGRTK